MQLLHRDLMSFGLGIVVRVGDVRAAVLVLEHRSGDGDSACHTDNPRPARSSLAPVLVRVPALIRFGPAPPPRHVASVRSSLLTRHATAPHSSVTMLGSIFPTAGL